MRRPTLSAILIVLVLAGCGREEASPPVAKPAPVTNETPSATAQAAALPPEVLAFRDALFKMRAGLKLGVNKAQYFESLKDLQFNLDRAESVASQKQREGVYFTTLKQASKKYEEAYKLINVDHKSLPEYAPVAKLDEKSDEVHRAIEDCKSRKRTFESIAGGSDPKLDQELSKLKMTSLEVSMNQMLELQKVQPELERALVAIEAQRDALWKDADELLSSLNASPHPSKPPEKKTETEKEPY